MKLIDVLPTMLLMSDARQCSEEGNSGTENDFDFDTVMTKHGYYLALLAPVHAAQQSRRHATCHLRAREDS